MTASPIQLVVRTRIRFIFCRERSFKLEFQFRVSLSLRFMPEGQIVIRAKSFAMLHHIIKHVSERGYIIKRQFHP